MSGTTFGGGSIALLAFATYVWAEVPKPEGIETLLVIEPTGEHPRNSEGDFVELGDGRVCLVYTRFRTGRSDFAEADIVSRVSEDGGRTWSEDRVLVENEGENNVMSVSLLKLEGGEILLFYLVKNGWGDLSAYVRRSADDLATLGPKTEVTVADGYHVVNNDRAVRLASGRLIVPAALHPCPDGTRETWSAYGIPRCFLSDDDGKTWRTDETDIDRTERPPVVYQEPGIVELGDGRLWMYVRTDGGTQYDSFSKDGGSTWSEPVPGKLKSPVSPATIERLPWTGDLLAVWNDHSGRHAFPEGKRTPLCVALSSDDGASWSPSRVVEGDPEGWYCYTAMLPVGDRVLLAYCAGDPQVGGLSRLKVLVLSKDWLYRD